MNYAKILKINILKHALFTLVMMFLDNKKYVYTIDKKKYG